MSSNGLLSIIKKAAREALEASNPMTTLYGNVISVNPLKIQIEQKLTLSEEFLILTKNVIDYNVQVKIDNTVKNIVIYNGLSINNKVMLLRIQGGQKYIVFDKVY